RLPPSTPGSPPSLGGEALPPPRLRRLPTGETSHAALPPELPPPRLSIQVPRVAENLPARYQDDCLRRRYAPIPRRSDAERARRPRLRSHLRFGSGPPGSPPWRGQSV